MSLGSLCPACASPGMSTFFELSGMPTHSMLLLSDRNEALHCAKGDIELALCERCGFISNRAFDPSLMKYSLDYESSQAFSPRFNTFAKELAIQLIKRHDLRGKDIVEIGCGGGDFLALLCELGGNRGVGIDPAAGKESLKDSHEITFIRDFYTERYSDCRGELLLCRHTLEHIWDTGEFIATVRRTIGDCWKPAVFFELPDVTRILQEVAFWDLYYEHCSYFSAGSLAWLFASKEFDVAGVSLAFDDQYLLLDAVPGNGALPQSLDNGDYLEAIHQDVAYFSKAYPTKLELWKNQLSIAAGQGQRCIVWGGGSKAVAFLNTLGARDEVDYVVDINPLKQDKYVAGTGHRIVGPEFLRHRKPDVILVMNPIYRDEIRDLAQSMGVDAELVAV